MATIDKRGDGWRAQVRRRGAQPKSKTFPTKAMAVEWAARIEREHAQREARGEAPASDMTLREAIEFGAPVPTDELGIGAAEDPMLVFDLTDQVRQTIQQTLYSLLVQRRSVFF